MFFPGNIKFHYDAEQGSVLFSSTWGPIRKRGGTTESFNSCFLGKTKRDFSFTIPIKTPIIFLSIFHGGRGHRENGCKGWKVAVNSSSYTYRYTQFSLRVKKGTKNVPGVIGIWPSHSNWDLTLEGHLSLKSFIIGNFIW